MNELFFFVSVITFCGSKNNLIFHFESGSDKKLDLVGNFRGDISKKYF